MKQNFTDPKTGIPYTLQGDYYLPDLLLPEEEDRPIEIYGERHKRYLQSHRKAFYSQMLISGKLLSYLADINEQATERFDVLVKQMAEKEGLTEQLKAENQMEWVGRMNNIRACAEEIINQEIIYA